MKTVTLIAVAAVGLLLLVKSRKKQGGDFTAPEGYGKATVGANPYTPQKTNVAALMPYGFVNLTPLGVPVTTSIYQP